MFTGPEFRQFRDLFQSSPAPTQKGTRMNSSYPKAYASVGSSSHARHGSRFPPTPKSVRFWKVLDGQELEVPKASAQDTGACLHEARGCSFTKSRFISVLGWVLFLGAILGLGVLVSGVSLQQFFSPASPVNAPE